MEVCDGDIVKDDIEFESAFAKDFSDLLGDFLSLRDKLLSVVLGDDRFEDFVTDGGQNTLVVVRADVVKDLGEFLLERSEQDSKSDVDRL